MKTRVLVARTAPARAIRSGLRRAVADPRRPASVAWLAILTLLIGLALCAAALVIGVAVVRAAPGALLWQHVYNGTGNGEDVFTALAPAPNGGVYVGGYTFASSEDFVAARYDADAAPPLAAHLQRHRRRLRPAHGGGRRRQGSLVVGYSPTASGSVVTLIIKYSPPASASGCAPSEARC